ncbi:MAG: tetratricopeptide repeat protein [Leptospirales bacterium]
MKLKLISAIVIFTFTLFSGGSGVYTQENLSHGDYYFDAIKVFAGKKGKAALKKSIKLLDQAIYQYNESEEVDGKELGIYYYTLAEIYRLDGQIQKALELQEKSFVILQKHRVPNGKLMADQYFLLSQMNIHLESFDKAEKSLRNAAEAYTELMDKVLESEVDSYTYFLARILLDWKTLKDNGHIQNDLELNNKKGNVLLGEVHMLIAGELFNKDANEYIQMIIYHAEQGVRLNPGISNSFDLLGVAYDISGDYEKAIAAYLEAIKLDPENSNVLYNLASSYSIQKNKEKAFEYLQKAVDAGFRSYSLMKQDETLEFIRKEQAYIDILKSIEPREMPSHFTDYQKAMSEWQRGRQKKAIDKMQKLIDICDGNAELRCPDFIGIYYSAMGSFLYNTKKPDEAVEYWTKSNLFLRQKSKDPSYLVASNLSNMATVEFAQDNLDVSLSQHEKAIEELVNYKSVNYLNKPQIDSTEKLIYFSIVEMGNIYDEIGKKSAHSLKGEKENTQYSKYETHVAAYFIGEEDFVLGVYHAIRAVELDSSNYDAYNVLGVAYDLSGEYEKALESFQTGLKLSPENPRLLYNLACNYSWQKKSKEALDTLTLALEAGFSSFSTMYSDVAFENIRETPKFKQLLNWAKMNEKIDQIDNQED